MTRPVLIVGSYLSPYVRKVLVCLELKEIAYEIDPIVPFYGNEAFGRMSPVRRIPVLVDGPVTLADSTVICEYLEECYPAVSLYPGGAAARAQARWLEEYADTRIGEVLIWHLYNQLVIRRAIWGEPPDEAVVTRALTEEIPEVLGYLENQVPATGYLFGHMCVADIAVASFFRNAAFARFAIDAGRWPATAAFVERMLAEPAFARLQRFEDLSLRTPVAKHRDALREAGAPISAMTFGTAVPRRGVLSI